MDISTISALGSSGVQAAQLMALLSASASGSSSDSSTAASGIPSDSVSISAAGQTISSTQGPASFMTDFNNLGSLIGSGDLTGAKQALAAMQAKMQAHQPSGSNPSDPLATDFAALGKALDSGDLASAQTAFKTLQTDLGSQSAASSAANPQLKDLDQLNSLFSSGDSTSTQDLNAKLLAAYLGSGSLT